MVKKIMRDPLFLAQKSVDATEADKQVIIDLLDTLRANLDHCVGMAANMIGVKKNIYVASGTVKTTGGYFSDKSAPLESGYKFQDVNITANGNQYNYQVVSE
jgi:peptide deformylase